MAAKSSIRDVGRVLNLELSKTDRIAKLIPSNIKLKEIIFPQDGNVNLKDKLNNVSKAELDLLKNMETDFNKSLSAYSQKYKSFMENYYSAVQQVEKCKADCLTKYPPGSPAESFNN